MKKRIAIMTLVGTIGAYASQGKNTAIKKVATSVESEVVQKESKKLLFNFDTSKYELIRTDTMKGWEGDDEQPVSYSLCKKEGKPALLLAYDYYKNKDMEALSTQRYNEMKEMAKDAKKFDGKEFTVTKEKGGFISKIYSS